MAIFVQKLVFFDFLKLKRNFMLSLLPKIMALYISLYQKMLRPDIALKTTKGTSEQFPQV